MVLYIEQMNECIYYQIQIQLQIYKYNMNYSTIW